MTTKLFTFKCIPSETKEAIEDAIEKLQEQLKDDTLKKGESFLLEDVKQVYVGRGDLCRCGCNGDYYSMNKEDDYYSPKDVEYYVDEMFSSYNSYEIEKIRDGLFEVITRKNHSGEYSVIVVELKENRFKPDLTTPYPTEEKTYPIQTTETK